MPTTLVNALEGLVVTGFALWAAVLMRRSGRTPSGVALAFVALGGLAWSFWSVTAWQRGSYVLLEAELAAGAVEAGAFGSALVCGMFCLRSRRLVLAVVCFAVALPALMYLTFRVALWVLFSVLMPMPTLWRPH